MYQHKNYRRSLLNMANNITITYIEHNELVISILSYALEAPDEDDSNDGQTKLGQRQLHSQT